MFSPTYYPDYIIHFPYYSRIKHFIFKKYFFIYIFPKYEQLKYIYINIYIHTHTHHTCKKKYTLINKLLSMPQVDEEELSGNL